MAKRTEPAVGEAVAVDLQKEVNLLELPYQERARLFTERYNELVQAFGISRMAVPAFFPQDNGSFSIKVNYTLQDLIRR